MPATYSPQEVQACPYIYSPAMTRLNARQSGARWAPLAHSPSGPPADKAEHDCEGSGGWERDMNAKISPGLLTNDIESRGVAQFADALDTARKDARK